MSTLLSHVNSDQKAILLGLSVKEDSFEFSSSIVSALAKAEVELDCLNEQIRETEKSIAMLTPECDKLDYALAASCGAISGIFDVFLVGKPKESPMGDITDEWFAERTKDFAKLCGWKDDGDKTLSSAILHLEQKFRIPYDQTGTRNTFLQINGITLDNHHFKSLGHNPNLMGLFFSILDQFNAISDNRGGTSHFVSLGNYITLKKDEDWFELRGKDLPSKLFCAFCNWLCHLISDVSGSHGSKGRGAGIPSPLWTWTNDIIVLKHSLGFHDSSFGEKANELALNIYEKGYDVRFQSAQAIPVFINEMLVRTVYAIRRLVAYFKLVDKEERSFSLLWEKCEPFSNASVKRMLTVAHGTFCLVDVGDATVRGFAAGGGTFNTPEFLMRLNIVGIGRLIISLYGECQRPIQVHRNEKEMEYINREKVVLEWYIDGLNELAEIYDTQLLDSFISDLQKSDMYIQTFNESILLARKMNVPEEEILKSKQEIDAYFHGES